MNLPNRKVLFQNPEIRSAVERMARGIVSWVEDRKITALDLIGVLEGARPLARDLSHALGRFLPEMDLTVHEVKVSATEGTSLKPNRRVEGMEALKAGLRDHWVVLVDDLVDSGKTLQALREELLRCGPRQVKTAVLVRKFGGQSGPVDFLGFDLGLDRNQMARKEIRDYWVWGYGMDESGERRELDHIGWTEIRSTPGVNG